MKDAYLLKGDGAVSKHFSSTEKALEPDEPGFDCQS